MLSSRFVLPGYSDRLLLGFWGYAAIGLWILFVSLTALKQASFPKWLAVLGLVLVIPHLLIPIGAYFKLQAVLTTVLVLAVAAPVWYIGMGTVLRKYNPA